jgi:pimeloyl-ACP methyl ester carboxylesterase
VRFIVVTCRQQPGASARSSSVVQTFQTITFGAPERQLFGICQRPEQPLSRPGVLLCPAWGQEAVRAHRLMRVLAERLVRLGFPVLRFDYFGTGDSMGDDADTDLSGWVSDIAQADQTLCDVLSVQETIWIGMRLGATAAWMAAAQAPTHLRKMVLWDPLLDGQAYLAYLRERHAAALEPDWQSARGVAFRLTARRTARDRAESDAEALGYALSSRLRAQLSALKPDDFDWPLRPAEVVVLCEPDEPSGRDVHAVARRASHPARVLDVVHGTDWTSDVADARSALVPMAPLAAMVQQVERCA